MKKLLLLISFVGSISAVSEIINDTELNVVIKFDEDQKFNVEGSISLIDNSPISVSFSNDNKSIVLKPKSYCQLSDSLAPLEVYLLTHSLKIFKKAIIQPSNNQKYKSFLLEINQPDFNAFNEIQITYSLTFEMNFE